MKDSSECSINDLRQDESTGGMWGWIAGIAVILLIGFLIIAGSNQKESSIPVAPQCILHESGNGVFRFENCGANTPTALSLFLKAHPDIRITAIDRWAGQLTVITESK